MIDKYIIVTTLCDNEKVKDEIIDNLLEKHLVAGSQTTKVHSKYYWHGRLEETNEYKIEFRTKEKYFDKIKEEILKYHDYELPEISYIEMKGTKEILKWIDDETAQKKAC